MPLIASFIEKIKVLDKDIDESLPIHQLIEEALKAAQIYSLSAKQEVTKTKRYFNEKEILNILEQLNIEGKDTCEAEAETSSIIPKTHEIPPYIEGRHAILFAILSLLQGALNNQSCSEKEIVITYQSDNHIFPGYAEIYQIFRGLVTQAMKQGWHIRNLCRLNKNIGRTLNLAGEIIAWAGFKETFSPSYFTKYGTLSPPSEIIVVKGVGVLLCFSAEDTGTIDRAFFHTQKAPVEALYHYVMKMHAGTPPLINIFATENDHYKFTTSKDRQAGDFFAISFDLHTYTIPLSLWEKYLRRSIGDEEAIKPHLTRIGERIHIFHEDVKKYKVRHIYHASAIEYLIKEGRYRYFCHYQLPTCEDIPDHLNHLLYLLKTYRNFEITLIFENQRDIIPFVLWEVEGGHSVVMNTLDMDTSSSYLRLAITEETVAGAFHDYFLEVWDQIAPKHRDKEYIISWLEDHLSRLREKISP